MKHPLKTLIPFLAAALVVVPMAAAQPAPAAKPAPTGKLVITVVDPSRLVLPGATVTVVGLEDATRKAALHPVRASDKGVVTLDGLPLGRYSASGEFPGFEIGVVKEIRLKAGENRHVLVLPMVRMTESVTVGRDPQTSASDRGATFGSALTREQIEALSDDPEEMSRQLQDMAGSGAVMRVDSFEGAQLPPKSMIKAIHITRDSFAAENHSAGGMFIDIITQPGIRPLSGMARFGLYDSSLDGRNPFVPKKGPAQSQNYSVNVGGTLIKDKSSFNIGANVNHGFITPNVYAATPAGTRAENLNLRMPTTYFSVNGSFDYAITKDQTLRAGVGWSTTTAKNQGVGAYDLAERAYTTDRRNFSLRIQEAGPVGRRFFINTRFGMNWSDTGNTSAFEGPTIYVLDAFRSGGAQRSGGTHTRSYSLQSDLDYVRGIHSWRLGISIDGGSYRSDDASNYLGTYTFENLAAYEAGLPRTFTKRLGDPNIAYQNWQMAIYLQDDIRVSKNLTLSPGVRAEAQTHVKDANNIGPRFGATWAPFKSGKTTLRVSFGQFFDWLSSGVYDQTLRVDGVRQQELNIFNPSYPYGGSGGLVPPTNRYLLDPDLQLAKNTRLSAGVDQQLTKTVRLNVIYADTHARGLLTGRNLNAPINGVRQNPALANIIEALAAGKSHTQSVSTNVSINLAPTGGGPVMIGGGGGVTMMIGAGGGTGSGPFFSLRRGLSLNVGYTWSKSENNVDGAFTTPASGTPDTEWGPASFDVRHRYTVGLTSNAIKNLTMMVYVTGSSGMPYTILTGRDENGDLMFNDRPAGVGRNSLRGAGQWTSFGMFTYTIGFGKKTMPLVGGLDLSAIARAAGVSLPAMAAPAAQPRYRLGISLNIQNLTNHANYYGYSGTMTSPFFGKPTTVQGVRTFNLSAMLSF